MATLCVYFGVINRISFYKWFDNNALMERVCDTRSQNSKNHLWTCTQSPYESDQVVNGLTSLHRVCFIFEYRRFSTVSRDFF